MQNNSRIVTALRDLVNMRIVNLQYQVLDIGVFAHSESSVWRQFKFWSVHGPSVDDLVAFGTWRM